MFTKLSQCEAIIWGYITNYFSTPTNLLYKPTNLETNIDMYVANYFIYNASFTLNLNFREATES